MSANANAKTLRRRLKSLVRMVQSKDLDCCATAPAKQFLDTIEEDLVHAAQAAEKLVLATQEEACSPTAS